MLALALLAGCEMGPNPETLVDDVQVIAGVAEPLAVAPGEPWTLTTTVADPLERGAEVLVWSCLEEECTTVRAELDDERSVIPWVSVAPVPLWILACDPGICDLDDPDPADLQDPTAWMQRLPIEGVSLALRQVMITEDPVDMRPTNPLLEKEPLLDKLSGVKRGDQRTLKFNVPGATTAWGYSTAGGFSRPSEDVASDGSVTLTWFAPEDPGDVRLYVVFEDAEGGTSVWREDATVTR